MPRAAVRAVWISVDDGIPQQVKDLAEEHKSLRERRSASPRWYTPRRTPRREASRRRAAWLAEVQRQRGAGELLDAQDVIVEYGVREELRARGWNHDNWAEAPDEAWNPGRWPGSRDRGAGGYPPWSRGRLSARCRRGAEPPSSEDDRVVGPGWGTLCLPPRPRVVVSRRGRPGSPSA
ncbi:hypothetical protein [Streptomyces sp. NPDC088812]|uniref:hypothetical protein n=1 Tax=Streptomyces sp. NPDC088812 TaxID=3365905 RepID=UPI0037F830E6